MEQTFIVTAVVAAVEFLRRAQVGDWFACASIIAAGAIGAVAGAFHAQGVVDVWTGIVLGLGASGIVTVASRVSAIGTSGAVLRDSRRTLRNR
jgi:hypothetical protein